MADRKQGGNRRRVRDVSGRFAPGDGGGPGRRRGSENQTTVDLRAIRATIAASWKMVDGPGLLEKLAVDDPAEYLRLVIRSLPKIDREADADHLPDLKIVIAQSDESKPVKPQLSDSHNGRRDQDRGRGPSG